MVILIIKSINTPGLIKQVAGVESDAWGEKPGDTVPDHVLTAIANNGGVLLGAYDGDQLLGFTLGWLGTINPDDNIPAAEQLKLVSHMIGVLGGYQDQRIGYKLKLAQRDWALDRGLDLVTWTYDPLESRNAYLNIHLLGCTCQTYNRDYYGEMSDEMNQGTVSDRFGVDWLITGDHVIDRISQSKNSRREGDSIEELLQSGVQLLNPARFDQGKWPLPIERIKFPDKQQILVEIPADIQTIRQSDPGNAGAWRFHTRDIFETLFSDNYQVFDFIYNPGDQPRSFYLMDKVLL